MDKTELILSIEPFSSFLISYWLAGQHVSWRGSFKAVLIADCDTSKQPVGWGDTSPASKTEENFKCWTSDWSKVQQELKGSNNYEKKVCQNVWKFVKLSQSGDISFNIVKMGQHV